MSAGAAAAAVEAVDERGWLMRAVLYSPKDMFAGLLACAAGSAIIVNAVFLQSGPHPAPMFGSIVTIPPALANANPLPRPRPTANRGRHARSTSSRAPDCAWTNPSTSPAKAKQAC